jgi:hypothetical protein
VKRTRLLLAVLVLSCAPAFAEPPPRQAPTLTYDNLLAVRMNPLGGGDELRLRYRIPLYGSDRAVLAQNFFGIAPAVMVAPAFVKLGLGVELAPLSVLHFYAGYEPTAYFGDLGALHSYPSANADYGSGAFDKSPSTAGATTYAAFLHQVVLSGTLQLAYRGFAFRSTLKALYVSAGTRNGDPVFYDTLYDVLLPKNGWMLQSDTDLLYVSKIRLTAGVRFSLLHTWYPASAFLPGEATDNPNTPISRIGPLVAYTFFERHHGAFDAPTLVLVTGWYLEHRYRTGELVSQGIPFVTLGFMFKGSFLDGARSVR